VNPALFLIAFVLGIVVGYQVVLLVTRRGKPKYFASAEYWVFLPGEVMPTQDAVMTRMVAQNPYARRGTSPVGAAEGLLFSDVRLHIALVLRNKNASAFRPDLFDANSEASAEVLELLNDAKSFVRLRYVSEDPLGDRRHLQFLPHAADAVAELGDGRLIYDKSAERFYLREELQELLRERFDVTGAEAHTRVVWNREGDGGWIETRGLVKVGHRELRAGPLDHDQRVVVTNVMEEAMRHLWEVRTFPSDLEVGAFDDRFKLFFGQARDRFVPVQVARVKTA